MSDYEFMNKNYVKAQLIDARRAGAMDAFRVAWQLADTKGATLQSVLLGLDAAIAKVEQTASSALMRIAQAEGMERG
jgi:hypothetical protein